MVSLLTIGSLSLLEEWQKKKNMQALVHAVKQSQAIKKPFQLVLVGDGPERKKLETLTHSLGVTDFVHFVGAVDWKQIQYYYQLSNVFVSASTTEAQGLTYIEAMASGCAVVAKADPSIESIVQHEETGFVFQKDEDLADVLQSIWAHPDLLARIQENGTVMLSLYQRKHSVVSSSAFILSNFEINSILNAMNVSNRRYFTGCGGLHD